MGNKATPTAARLHQRRFGRLSGSSRTMYVPAITKHASVAKSSHFRPLISIGGAGVNSTCRRWSIARGYAALVTACSELRDGADVGFTALDTPAPTDPAALTFLTMTTKPSFRAEFKVGEWGKTAAHMARWANTRGDRGPWSDVATAKVAARGATVAA
jgi:hypothetical protein